MAHKVDPPRFPRNAKGYSSSSRGNSFDGYPSRVLPAESKAGRKMGTRPPSISAFLSSKLAPPKFVLVRIYICITVEALLQIFFFLSLSLSLFSLHTWNRWRQGYRRTTPLLENVFRLFPRVSAKETAQLSRAIISSGTDRGNRASVQRISCVAATPR